MRRNTFYQNLPYNPFGSRIVQRPMYFLDDSSSDEESLFTSTSRFRHRNGPITLSRTRGPTATASASTSSGHGRGSTARNVRARRDRNGSPPVVFRERLTRRQIVRPISNIRRRRRVQFSPESSDTDSPRSDASNSNIVMSRGRPAPANVRTNLRGSVNDSTTWRDPHSSSIVSSLMLRNVELPFFLAVINNTELMGLWDLMHLPPGNPAATDDMLNTLPTVKVTSSEVDNQLACSICLEEYILQEQVSKLPCSHIYHRHCVNEWLKLHPSCPVCRLEVFPVEMRDDEPSMTHGMSFL